MRFRILFHPDFTVGFGISPNQPSKRLAGFTAGGEFHPAPSIAYIFLHLCGKKSRESEYIFVNFRLI